MALQLGQLVFPQRFFSKVCKPKPNIQQIVEAKCRQHRLICSGAKPNVSETIYQPTIWSHDFIQLLDDNFPINCKEKLRELEKNVIAMNDDFENGSFSTLEVLEHIDDIERLRLGYRFRNHIRRALDTITTPIYEVDVGHEESLHEASLRFRILRQHDYNVSQIFLGDLRKVKVAPLDLYRQITKAYALVTVIDDIYDIYGSLDELKMFTDAVKRWDINAIEHMPEYLQLAIKAPYKTTTEMSSYTSIGQGEDILPILVKVWAELFEAFLLEAKWTHDQHIPTLEVYLDNAWQSMSGVVLLTHGYFLCNQEINKDVVESLDMYHDLMKWSSVIFRLYNDWATSSIEQGKTANAISSYMHKNDLSWEVAHKHIKTLIDEAWRKLINVHLACTKELANPFIDMATNLARISLCTYLYGDGRSS